MELMKYVACLCIERAFGSAVMCSFGLEDRRRTFAIIGAERDHKAHIGIAEITAALALPAWVELYQVNAS